MARFGPKPLIVDMTTINLEDVAPWACRKCKRHLSYTAYHEMESCTYGRRKTCVDCTREQLRAKRKPHMEKWAKVRKNFSITRDQFDAIFEAQGFGCGVCGSTDPRSPRGWCIDHDHDCCPQPGRSCGKCIRGVLCTNCNLMLGHARDETERLSAGIAYLARGVVSVGVQ